MGAERPRSQELRSPSRISKVDLQAVGRVGGDQQRQREEGEREPGCGGAGRRWDVRVTSTGAPDVSLDIRLVRGKLTLGLGSDSGAFVVLCWDGPFPAGSTPQRGCAPHGRCCKDRKVGVGTRGPGQQSPAAPRRGTPALGRGSSRRCKPARWLPVAACPPSVGTAVNPCKGAGHRGIPCSQAG